MTVPSLSPNRLIHETSPYLLQHAHNPVDWFPWGDEAFLKSAKENKPIFLSIGYATCHWCHVMERESFEDAEVATFLNQHFVSIKLDREERPDIDHVYMGVCQALTGSGGWPLTIVMTPDKRPFFAGTYFSKHTQYGRPGLLDFLAQLQEAWEKDHGKVLASAEEIVRHVRQGTGSKSGPELGAKNLEACFKQYSQNFDADRGGFGSAPKFPSPHNLLWLMRWWKRSGNPEALKMVETTLQEMARGGLHDYLGGGFHRYSTDERWLVPHFEKMLYDQAMLAMAYTEAYQITGNELYKNIAKGIFTYVLRDMTSPEGGFYSAEDADSEGLEGKFYVWKPAEINEVLGLERGGLFCEAHDVTEGGNFHEPHGPTGCSIIHGELTTGFTEDRVKLLAVRFKRVRPLRDEKILADWNGLMIAALAKAARAFQEPMYAAKATTCARFIHEKMMTKEGKLLHRHGRGISGISALLDDHAFVVWGLIELYQASLDPRCLEQALHLHEAMLKEFWDENEGSFWMASREGEKLFTDPKEIYDGAYPSGNSVAALNSLRLSRMTGRTEYEAHAASIMKAFSQDVSRAPTAHALLMTALDFAIGPSLELVFAGELLDPGTQALVGIVNSRFLPGAVLLHHPMDPSVAGVIERLSPFIKPQVTVGGKAAAYLCEDFTCREPVTAPARLAELLR